MNDFIEKAFIGVVGIVVIAMLYLWLLILPVSAYTGKKCNEKGWSDNDVTWNLNKYCKRTVLGTTVIVPLDSAYVVKNDSLRIVNVK